MNKSHSVPTTGVFDKIGTQATTVTCFTSEVK